MWVTVSGKHTFSLVTLLDMNSLTIPTHFTETGDFNQSAIVVSVFDIRITILANSSLYTSTGQNGESLYT